MINDGTDSRVLTEEEEEEEEEEEGTGGLEGRAVLPVCQ
jgi:hypothetical protein